MNTVRNSDIIINSLHSYLDKKFIYLTRLIIEISQESLSIKLKGKLQKFFLTFMVIFLVGKKLTVIITQQKIIIIL